MGTCVWSPLASGLLTGKYNDGVIPPYSRLAIQDHPIINRLRAGYFNDEGRRKIRKSETCLPTRTSNPVSRE
ncbi:hypothetical protein K492DRAFT_191801 [Lichtheimia hyalospora FSU 10163]|nr:hypothetical protein K492DRAFT_191801 [Lichtheimia hyalospora FSU 10163]